MAFLSHLRSLGVFLALAFWATLLASGFSASRQPNIYSDYEKASKDAKTSETWLRVWRSQIYTQLQSLQSERAFQPLHIYMNGDSSFRQQKNFLCSLLQPGFEQRGGPCWAVGEYGSAVQQQVLRAVAPTGSVWQTNPPCHS